MEKYLKPNPQKHQHRSHRIGWLRAAVLGANDGIISTASLIVGIAAANTPQHNILIAGVAALIAGAMSMAAGEYVSVSSQLDTEKADIARERLALGEDPNHGYQELMDIYTRRGLDKSLAETVVRQLMAHDPVAAQARDKLGITDTMKARPLQAAITSGVTFSLGAFLPLLVILVAPLSYLILATSIVSLFSLTLLGVLAALTGGSHIGVSTFRITVWGAVALLLTTGIGSLFGAVVY